MKSLAQGVFMFCDLNQKDWDDYIDIVLMSFRMSVQDTMKVTPYMMLYGRDPVMPFDLKMPRPARVCEGAEKDFVARIKHRVCQAQEVAKEHLLQDQARKRARIKTKSREFVLGQKVLVFNPSVRLGRVSKLTHHWTGPFTVVGHPSLVTVELISPKGQKVIVNVARMKAYHTRQVTEGEWEEIVEHVAMSPVTKVQSLVVKTAPSPNAGRKIRRIIARQRKRGEDGKLHVMYHIVLAGRKRPVWELDENLRGCETLIDEFESQVKEMEGAEGTEHSRGTKEVRVSEK